MVLWCLHEYCVSALRAAEKREEMLERNRDPCQWQLWHRECGLRAHELQIPRVNCGPEISGTKSCKKRAL